MSEPMKDPAELERERASDVPEGAELRPDGSYVDTKATEDQKALRDAEVESSEDEEAKRAALREQGDQAAYPREVASPTPVANTGTVAAQADSNPNP